MTQNYDSGQRSCSKEQLQSLAWSRHFPPQHPLCPTCLFLLPTVKPDCSSYCLYVLSQCTHQCSDWWCQQPQPRRDEMSRTKSLWIHAPKSALPSVYRCWRAQVMLKGSYVGRFEIASDHSAGNCTANGPGRWDSGGMVRFSVQIKDVEIAAYSAPIFRSVFLLWWLWLMSPTRRSRIKKYTREKIGLFF